jgi:hypothetical protein
VVSHLTSDIGGQPVQTPTFSVVAEGPSDFWILKFALGGYFNNKDIVVDPLQPKPGTIGGWTEVLRFLGSEEFLPAFEYKDYVVIHIDTDCCDATHFDVPKRHADGRVLEVDELVTAVRERLIAAIGATRFELVANRVVFAIAVDSTECWMLPFYWTDGRRAKTVNCLRSLNEQLSTQGFGIDPEKKDVRYYQRIGKQLLKPKPLREKAVHNPSFRILFENLDRVFGRYVPADDAAP